MDFKLLASTFALIFLAELGDKTQLAAFAATAGSRSPWSIFVGASAALVLSTALAVLFGEAIQRLVPQHYLKLGAGILFVVFGGLLIASAIHTRSAATAPAAAGRPGVLARLALDTAAQFEASASQDYRTLAAATTDARLKELLSRLAAAEEGHLARVKDTSGAHGDTTWQAGNLQPVADMKPAVEKINDAAVAVLEQAIGHEKATARFYEGLAVAAPLASLRSAFGALAREEHEHARALEEFRRTA